MAIKPVEDLSRVGQAKREQILTAAQRLFLERGFERTSMEAIREAAGVSKPTLYNHYLSKEALFADVLTRIVSEIGGEWIPAVESGTIPLETIADLKRALAAMLAQASSGFMRPEYLGLMRLVIGEMLQFPALSDMLRSIGPERGLRLIASVLERAHDRGLITVADSGLAARVFFGPLVVHIIVDGLIASGKPQPLTPARIDALVDMFLRSVGGVAADRAA